MVRGSLLPIRRYLLDRMVLRPTRHAIEHPTQERQMLDLGGRMLESFVQRNQDSDSEPDLLVLKFPGTAGRAERSTGFPMDFFEDEEVDVEVWTWNPPGYGRSPGRASLSGIAEAAIGFWNHVTERRAGSQTSVWLCGNSLGCVSALNVAAATQPSATTCGMILRNPPPLLSVVRRVARSYPFSRWVDPVVDSLCDSMNAMSTATKVELPAVFLQSELDSLVTPDDQNRLIDAYLGPTRVVVLEGLEHGCMATDEHQPKIESSLRWLWTATGGNSDGK